MNVIKSRRMPIVLALSIMLMGLLIVTLLYAQAVLAGGWSTFVVDTDGNVGMYTSIALDASGNPHISYYDKTSGKIKYAYIGKYEDNSWRPFEPYNIDTATVPNANDEGMYTSIAVDKNNRPHVSYYNQKNKELWYAYRTASDTWERQEVDESTTDDVGRYSSLALDDTGTPHISYYDKVNGNLKYAYRNSSGQFVCETVTATNHDDSASDVGRYTSIAVSSSSNSRPLIYISYYDLGGAGDYENKNLKCAYRDANGIWWTETVDNTGDVGTFTSIALDANGKPNISYYDATAGKEDLKFARKNVSGDWDITTVVMPVPDTNGNGIPDEEMDYNKKVGKWSSLKTDISGNPHISYWNETDRCLEYAYKDIQGWKKERVDPVDLNTAYKVGEYSAIAIDKNNDVHISYYFSYNNGNQDLKRAYKNMTPPTISEVSPEENTTTVEKDITIRVKFSEPVLISNRDAITLKKNGTTDVSANKYVLSAPEQNILLIQPSNLLESGTRYVVTIPAGSITDGAGNPLASTYSFSFTVKDTTPPVTTVSTNVSPSSNDWYSTAPTITLRASDIGSGVKNICYRWNNETIHTVNNTNITLSAREGDNTLYFYAVDNLNNTETEKMQRFRIDTTKPTTRVNINPSSPDGIRPDEYPEPRLWYKTTPIISLSVEDTGSGPAKISYKWDNRSWIEFNGNATTVSMVINGEKIQGQGRTLYYKSKDAVGNEEPERKLVFNIDDELPSISITANPAQPDKGDWYTTTVPAITISASKPLNRNIPLTILYKWDGPSETTRTISNGGQITAPQGDRLLTVVATDIIGNTRKETKQLKVDTIPPAMPAFSRIDTITVNNLNFIGITGTTDATQTTTRVKAIDTLGNSTPEITAMVGSNRTFTATLNLRDLKDGTIIFIAEATDQAGNKRTGTTTKLKDTTPPVTSISVNPTTPNGINGWYKKNDANTMPRITLTANDTESGTRIIYYKWGSDGPETTYTVPFTANFQGERTLFAYAIDRAENTETAMKQLEFKVDTVEPATPKLDNIDTITAGNVTTVTVSGRIEEDEVETGLTIHVRASDGTTPGYREETTTIDANGLFSVDLNLSELRDGNARFTAFTKDEAGNESQACEEKRVLKDTRPPATTIAVTPANPGGNNGWYNKMSAPTITVSAVDTGSAVASIHYKWDSGAFTQIANNTQISTLEGTHTIAAYSVDTLGNTGNNIANIKQKEFKIDTMAPTPINTDTISIETLSDGRFKVTWNGSTDQLPGSGISHYGIIINSGTERTTSGSSYYITPTSTDSYVISIKAYDKAGNYSSASSKTYTSSAASITGGGSNVSVALKAQGETRLAFVSFRSVNNSGSVSITVSTDDVGKPAPTGFSLLGKYYNITATPGITDDTITVSIPYSVDGLTPQQEDELESKIELYHYNSATSEWEKITTSIDKVNNIITGETKSLSPFAVFKEKAPQGDPTTPRQDPDQRRQDPGPVPDQGPVGGPVTPTQPTVLAYRTQPIFSDVPSNAWYETSVSKLVSRGVLGGYTDGTFKPDKSITKEEFVKLICYAMDWNLVNPAKPSFKDVPKSNWAYKYIETAKTRGIAKGYDDGTFRPTRSITRAEMARIIADVLKLPKGSSKLKDINTSWAKDSINACVKAGILKGYTDNTFKPGKSVSRAEASEIIARVLEYN